MKGLIKIVLSNGQDRISRSFSATDCYSDKYLTPNFISFCVTYWNQLNDSDWSLEDKIKSMTFKFVKFLSFVYDFKDRLELIFSLDSKNEPHSESLNLNYEFEDVRFDLYFVQSK